jgi:hypothetical protein
VSQLLLDRTADLSKVSLDQAVKHLFRLSFLEQFIKPFHVYLRLQSCSKLCKRDFVIERVLKL